MKLVPGKLKLVTRMVVSLVGTVIFLYIIICIVVATITSRLAQQSGVEMVVSKTQEIAHKTETYINKTIENLNSLALSSLAIKDRNPDRELLRSIFIENLLKNKNIFSIWEMWEPNAFDRKDIQFSNDPIYRECNGKMGFMYYASGKEYELNRITQNQYTNGNYQLVKNNNGQLIQEPHHYSYTRKAGDSVYQTSIVMPLEKENTFYGVIGVSVSLDSVRNQFFNEPIFSKGFASILSNNLQVATSQDKKIQGKALSSLIDQNLQQIQDSLKNGKIYSYIDVSNQTGNKVVRCFVPVNLANSNTPWCVMVEVPLSEVTASSGEILLFLILFGIFGISLLTGLTYIIARKISNPIIQSAGFAKEIASGNLDAKIIISERRDEVGEMARAQIEMVSQLKSVVDNVRINVDNIFSASQQLNSTAIDLSQGANEQAASTEEVSASMEQMVANVDQNAVNANQTEQIAAKAAVDIEHVSNAVISTVDAMKKIAEKISIIGVIAEKTDLLAINAAIEAARAGEHGLGFTVVASEIRKLAERSQDAAKQIDELTKTSVKIADQSGYELMNIVPDIKKTAELVQEITASSVEQKAGAEQINKALMQLNSVTQRNAAASEEMSASSEELHAQAEQLRDIISFYKSVEKVIKPKPTTIAKSIINKPEKKEKEEYNTDMMYSNIESDNSFEKY